MPEQLDRVERFAELLYEEKISEEWDAVIPVIGDEGAGKSTFILEFVWMWMQVRGVEPTVEKVLNAIVWDDRAEFKSALVEYPNQAAVPVMDAARILFAKDAMQAEQKEAEKDMLDMRIGERVILLGYQSWKDMPPILRRRRAKYAFRIPTRGTVYGYNRSSLDEVHDSGGDSWPKADLTDSFPSLEGTDLWEEFQRLDEEHKRERIMGDEDEEDERSLKDIVAEIQSEGVEQFISVNDTNGQRNLDKDLIRYYYDLSLNDARTVKKVLATEVDLSALEDQQEAASP